MNNKERWPAGYGVERSKNLIEKESIWTELIRSSGIPAEQAEELVQVLKTSSPISSFIDHFSNFLDSINPDILKYNRETSIKYGRRSEIELSDNEKTLLALFTEIRDDAHSGT